jgi:hypothetical protein
MRSRMSVRVKTSPPRANQEFQNPQWLRRQLDAVPLPSQFAGGGVELEYVKSENSGRFTHRKLMLHSPRVHGSENPTVAKIIISA